MKCDELKAKHVVDVYDDYAEHPFEEHSQVYLKSEADKVIADKDKEIAELKEERRWRKYSEELPKDGSEVIATDGDGIWLCYKTTMSDGLPWFQPDGLPHIENITHWMPLPSAPKEQA